MAKRQLVAIGKIGAGSAFGQAAAALSSLALARIFLPSEFGAFAAVLGLVIILGPAACLRLEMSIPIVQERHTAALALRACITASLSVVVLLFAMIAILDKQLSSLLGAPRALFLLGVANVCAIGVFNALNQLALRERNYGAVALRNVSQPVATALLQIAAGLISPSATSLMVGSVGGGIVSILILKPAGLDYRPLGLARFKHFVQAHRELVVYLAPAALVNSAGLQIPLVLGASLFGAQFAGWFGMSQRLLAVPVAVLGLSLGQVILAEFAERRRANAEGLLPQFYRASRALGAVGAACGIAVAVSAPSVFELLLGDEYRRSGEFARAFSLAVALQLLASPLSVLVVVMGRARWQAMWDIVRLATVVATLMLVSNLGADPMTAVLWLSLTNGVLYFAQWLLVRAAIANPAEPTMDSLSDIGREG